MSEPLSTYHRLTSPMGSFFCKTPTRSPAWTLNSICFWARYTCLAWYKLAEAYLALSWNFNGQNILPKSAFNLLLYCFYLCPCSCCLQWHRGWSSWFLGLDSGGRIGGSCHGDNSWCRLDASRPGLVIHIPGSMWRQCLGDGRCADGVTRHLLADYGVPHQETVGWWAI